MNEIASLNEYLNLRVIEGAKDKRIGKVHNFVFHPSEKRLIGFLVKRPDAALMFHRKDLFVALDGCDLEDGRLKISDEKGSTDSAACKRLGVNWDDCVLWWGMPVSTEDGTNLGRVNEIHFDRLTGKIIDIGVETTATARILLGERVITASEIRGFRRGMGQAVVATEDGEFAKEDLGAILVSDGVKAAPTEGGVAEKAGTATAVATRKVKKVVKKASEATKPTVDEASKVAGEAVNKGLYATGRQIGRASGMFSSFKEEFKKASK